MRTPAGDDKDAKADIGTTRKRCLGSLMSAVRGEPDNICSL